MGTPVQPVILVVDDDPGIRESLCALFEDAHYPVREARDGIEALAILSQETWPCIMLLDRMMARLDGIQTLHRLVEMPDSVRRRVSILFMTARSDPLDPASDEFIRRNTFATIHKPFNLDSLLALAAQAGERLIPAGPDVRDRGA
jgi:CheY-like chemotaxis protein